MRLFGQTKVSFERRVLRTLMAGGLFIGLLIIFAVPPADLPLAACAFHSVTGHNCLTCGLTRSLHAISHGDLTASVRYHLLGPVLFTGMLLCFMVCAAEAASGRRSAIRVGRKIRNQACIVFAAVWIAYWATRLATEFIA